MFKEFREFIARGNVMDLAVGIIIGAAFTAIVNSLVNDLIMPPISLLLGGIDFNNMFIILRGTPAPTLAAAKAAGDVTLNYGAFIQALVNFLIVAFVIFLIVRQVNRLKASPPPTPTSKPCPFCLSSINAAATRCPNCTSQLTA